MEKSYFFRDFFHLPATPFPIPAQKFPDRAENFDPDGGGYSEAGVTKSDNQKYLRRLSITSASSSL